MPAARNAQPITDTWDAFYCRLSRDDDSEGDSNSIAHQKQILEKYGRDHGIENYRFYVDDGYSGTNFNRPGFKEMLADIEAGHIKTVLVKDMSRFGRNYLEVGMYTEIMFPEKGIRFIAINDGVDSERDDNDFTPFRNIINEWYAKDTSRKITAVLHAKGMSGKRLASQAPYGYVIGEDGKLIRDEETAPVVQMIFQLCAEGNGPGTIARMLKERGIATPGTIEFRRTGRTRFYHADDPYGWTSASVAQLLGRKEYLGCTVNFKTVKKSYKNKNSVLNKQENQAVFEGTHEPLIDTELWNVVQKNREQRHRPTRLGKPALFAGVLFCADCGSRMVIHRITTGNTKGKSYSPSYRCRNYASDHGFHRCEMHYIRENILIELVLDNLQAVMSYARDYEDEFVRQITDNTMAEQAKQHAVCKRQLDQQTRRIDEIDSIIQRLYEDNVTGKLTDDRFVKMSATYEREQRELEASTTELKKAMAVCETQKVNIESFLKLVKSYTQPEQLTPEILHMFIEKIAVHKADYTSGDREMQIDIHYNFVGQLDMSVANSKTRKMTRAELEHRKIVRGKTQSGVL